jgi:hypothetical protein
VGPVDSLASNAPGNQQQINVLSVGPTFHFQFADALRGQVELRYINSYASKVDDFNSSRGLAALRLYHDISPTDQISLNVESQRVVLDNNPAVDDTTGSANYNRNEIFARYIRRLAKFSIDAEAGWTTINFARLPDQSSPMGRITLTWLPTLRSTFDLEGAYQYSDAAQDTLSPPGQPLGQGLVGQGLGQGLGQPIFNAGGIAVGDTAIDSQTYLERVLQATYSFHTERWSMSASPMYDKLNYINGPALNQTGRGGTFMVAYRLRPTVTVSTFASAQRLTYENLDRTDKTYQYGVDLTKQWTPHWSSRVSFTRQSRQSDAPGQSYHESEIYFGVVYKR